MHDRWRPPWLLLLAAGLTLLAIAGALTLLVGAVKAPLPGDRWLVVAVQDVPGFRSIAPGVNRLGDLEWYVLPPAAFAGLIAAIVLPEARRLAIWAATLLGGCIVTIDLDQALKVAVGSPRPVAEASIRVTEVQSTYGFPSGHVYGDVLLYGALAVIALRLLPRPAATAVTVACAAVIVLAGPARMATGAHWPVDTLGGYLWGAAVLCLLLVLAEFAASRLAGSRGRHGP